MKYSDEHIDALVDRLEQYEEAFEGKERDGRACLMCVTAHPFRCVNCLIRDYGKMGCSGLNRERIRRWVKIGICYHRIRIEALDWYREMIKRANKRLTESGNKWRVEGKYETKDPN